MRHALPLLLLSACLTTGALAQSITRVKSAHDTAQTASRLLDEVKSRGFTVIADVDHAGAASKVDASLRPTRVIMFGNPRGGTPIMACAQTMGLDLPLRALIWQEADGGVFVGYEPLAAIARRHGADECAKGPIEAATKAVTAIVEAATK